MPRHEGGCLCGALRYATTADPVRISFCHCTFCQRATGAAYLVEPIFDSGDFTVLQGTPTIYDQVSKGSGKVVHVHFCATCGTKIALRFERFPDAVGIFAGTFDDPNWFDVTAENAKHIFLNVARADTIIPAGLPTFENHATTNDGEPLPVTVFDAPHRIGG